MFIQEYDFSLLIMKFRSNLLTNKTELLAMKMRPNLLTIFTVSYEIKA